MKIKDNLDLQGYLLQNFCVDNYDSLDSISNKGDGRMVFLTGNSTDAKYRHVNVWDGTNFKALAYLEDVAMNDDFIALQEKVALLAGDVDTDAIISNMKEVSAFLEGFAEDASLMDYLTSELGKKLDKAGGTVSGNLAVNGYLSNKGHFIGVNDNDNAEWYVTDKGWQHDYALLHAGNYSNYALPLTGGIITGALTIKTGVDAKLVLDNTDTDTNYSLIDFRQNGVSIGMLGILEVGSTDLAWRRKTLLHSGNVGEYALKKASGNYYENLDTVLASNTSEFYDYFQRISTDGKTVSSSDIGSARKGAIRLAGGGSESQLLFDHYNGKMHYRNYGSSSWSDWKTIAFTDSDITGKSGDSDMLGGLAASRYFLRHSSIASDTQDADTWNVFGFARLANSGGDALNWPYSYGYALNYKGHEVTRAGFQFFVTSSGNSLLFRRHWESWGDWRTVAFTDSNVASATKLETARTIWGQSFDGTGDVSGNLVLNNNAGILSYDTTGTARYLLHLSNNNALLIGNTTAQAGYSTYINGNDINLRYGTSRTTGLILNSSGNVTIGASDLAGTTYKLLVDGKLGMRNGTNASVVLAHENNALYLGYSNVNSYDTIVSGKNVLLMPSGGSVLIGTTEDDGSGAKLQIEGPLRVYEATQRRLYTRLQSSSLQIGRISSKYTGGYYGGITVGEDGTTSGYIAGIYDSKADNKRQFFYGGTKVEDAAILIQGVSGNVLIGTTDDNGSNARLQVAGRIHATNATITQHIYANAFRTEGENGIWKGNSFTSSLTATDLVIKGDTVRLIGDLHVTGNIIADGEVSAGGAGEEGSTSGSGAGAFHSESIAVGATQATIAHGLGTDDIVVSIYEKDATSGLWSMILTDIEITDADNIRVTFGSATTVEHKVVIMGAVA